MKAENLLYEHRRTIHISVKSAVADSGIAAPVLKLSESRNLQQRSQVDGFHGKSLDMLVY